MKNKKLILVGANNPEILSLIDDIYSSTGYEILGWVDNDINKVGLNIFGIKVLGSPEILSKAEFKYVDVINCITSNGIVRREVFQQLSKLNIKPVTLIHPSVNTKFVKIGNGVIVHRGVILESHVDIGDGSALASGVIVCHESKIGRYCFLSSGVVIAGKVELGDAVTVWTGANITPRLEIESEAVIGAGATVFENVSERTTVAGNPARRVMRLS